MTAIEHEKYEGGEENGGGGGVKGRSPVRGHPSFYYLLCTHGHCPFFRNLGYALQARRVPRMNFGKTGDIIADTVLLHP